MEATNTPLVIHQIYEVQGVKIGGVIVPTDKIAFFDPRVYDNLIEQVIPEDCVVSPHRLVIQNGLIIGEVVLTYIKEERMLYAEFQRYPHKENT